jgi:NTP pyrophosphatase (non-canonical NTP hydrolase)
LLTPKRWTAVALSAVICGSFRRDPVALRAEFSELQGAGCTVLSPLDLDFVGEVEGFVYRVGELSQTTADVERHHLEAMRAADLIWLHCPDGYVGSSAAMELGFARALGVRVFARQRPRDVTLADLVVVCRSPGAAVRQVRDELGPVPADALPALQGYYSRAAMRRGWSGETSEQTIELLRGEIDELQEALESESGVATALELADVQLYLVHLANVLALDLGAAVRDKERINAERFEVAAGERIAA